VPTLKNADDGIEIIENYKIAIVAWFRLQVYKKNRTSDHKCAGADALKVAEYAAEVFKLDASHVN
jgi:hypothetical protein